MIQKAIVNQKVLVLGAKDAVNVKQNVAVTQSQIQRSASNGKRAENPPPEVVVEDDSRAAESGSVGTTSVGTTSAPDPRRVVSTFQLFLSRYSFSDRFCYRDQLDVAQIFKSPSLNKSSL